MSIFRFMLATCALLLAMAGCSTDEPAAVSACGTNQSGDDSGDKGAGGGVALKLVYDHASGWESRDVTDLEQGSVSATFDAYLPTGGTWDASVRCTLEANLHAGFAATQTTPLVTYAEIAGHPAAMRVTVTQDATQPGTYWFAIAGAAVLPIRPSASHTFRTEPPADLLPRFVMPGFFLRTVGACQHPVEVKLSDAGATSGSVKWRVRFSEDLTSLATVINLEGELATSPTLVASVEKTGPREVELSVSATQVDATSRLKLEFDSTFGIASKFGSLGGCIPGDVAIALPIWSEIPNAPFRPATPYSALARKLAPALYQ